MDTLNKFSSVSEGIDDLLKKIHFVDPFNSAKVSETLERMTEEQRYFYLLGYTDRMEENESKSSEIGEIEKAICQLRTKYTDKILLYLYKEGKCYHGDLASNPEIQLSSSGLTAVIKKINTCQIPLIEIIKEGKFKIYSLTDAGKRYVKERLISPSFSPSDSSMISGSEEMEQSASVREEEYPANMSNLTDGDLNENIIQEIYEEAVKTFERKEQDL